VASQRPGDVSNEDLVRGLLERWNEGDRFAVEKHLHPEVEIRTLRSELETRPYRGVEGFRRGIADFDQDWESVRMDVTEVRCGQDRVVVIGTLRSRGKASGIDLAMPLAMLWSFEGDRIIEIRSFAEASDALRTAGLEG
jgi:ketosteroid isomerase-like protein